MRKLDHAAVLLGCLLGLGACAPVEDLGDQNPSAPVNEIPDQGITPAEFAAGRGQPVDEAEPDEGTDPDAWVLLGRADRASENKSDDGTVVQGDAACTWATGYSAGSTVRICVTTVDGRLVEQNTAQAYQAMKAAAARSGVRLYIVSGWRTMEQQRALYAAYQAGTGNLAARPGYSNHQNGLALDLNASASGVLSWLNAHGDEFGFRRTVPSENWHWEYRGGPWSGSSTPAPSSSQCYSNTLREWKGQGVCVQSRSDSEWYQCYQGSWRSGRATHGACSETYALPARPPAGATSCYSSTLGRNMPLGTCVQAWSDRLWYQCIPAGWVHSAALPGGAGPQGACTSRHAL